MPLIANVASFGRHLERGERRTERGAQLRRVGRAARAASRRSRRESVGATCSGVSDERCRADGHGHRRREHGCAPAGGAGGRRLRRPPGWSARSGACPRRSVPGAERGEHLLRRPRRAGCPIPDFGADLDDLRALEPQPAVDQPLAGLRDPARRAPRRAVVVDAHDERDVVGAEPAQHGAAELVERVVAPTGPARRAARTLAAAFDVQPIALGSTDELGACRRARGSACARSRAGAVRRTAASASGSDIPLASTSPTSTPGST